MVIATGETLRQLPFAAQNPRVLEKGCPAGNGDFQGLSIQWGRSGHCAGSVWYRFSENGKSIFFSGDYTEDALVYACDPIRKQRAGLAVLDCAYGRDDTPYAAACRRLLQETERLLAAHGLLLFPVPKYGRGLEILKLLSEGLGMFPIMRTRSFWKTSPRGRPAGSGIGRQRPSRRFGFTAGRSGASSLSAIRSCAARRRGAPPGRRFLRAGGPL